MRTPPVTSAHVSADEDKCTYEIWTLAERRGRSSVTGVVCLLRLHSFRFLPLVQTLLHTLPFDLDPRAPKPSHPLIPHPRGGKISFFFWQNRLFFLPPSSHISHLSEPQPGRSFLSIFYERESNPTGRSWRTAAIDEWRASSRS